jgi:hypothetical protein
MLCPRMRTTTKRTEAQLSPFYADSSIESAPRHFNGKKNQSSIVETSGPHLAKLLRDLSSRFDDDYDC